MSDVWQSEPPPIDKKHVYHIWLSSGGYQKHPALGEWDTKIQLAIARTKYTEWWGKRKLYRTISNFIPIPNPPFLIIIGWIAFLSLCCILGWCCCESDREYKKGYLKNINFNPTLGLILGTLTLITILLALFFLRFQYHWLFPTG